MNRTRKYETGNSVLRVTGIAWQGFRAKHEYSIPFAFQLVTMADAKKLAGDFQSLERAEIVTTRKEVKETVTTKRIG